MKLNKEQITALANKVIEIIKSKTPKNKVTKESERAFRKAHSIIEEKNKEYVKIGAELSKLKNDFLSQYKGASTSYGNNYITNVEDSFNSYKKAAESSYTKPIPSQSTVYNDIVLNTAFSSAESLEDFIKELVEKYS